MSPTFNDRSLAPRLLPLATDTRQGMAAQMALIALGRAKYVPALEPLVERLNDRELGAHAAEGLRLLGDPRALPAVEAMTPRSDYARTARQRAIRALTRTPMSIDLTFTGHAVGSDRSPTSGTASRSRSPRTRAGA